MQRIVDAVLVVEYGKDAGLAEPPGVDTAAVVVVPRKHTAAAVVDFAVAAAADDNTPLVDYVNASDDGRRVGPSQPVLHSEQRKFETAAPMQLLPLQQRYYWWWLQQPRLT